MSHARAALQPPVAAYPMLKSGSWLKRRLNIWIRRGGHELGARTAWRCNRIAARARKSLVFVVGTVRPSLLAASFSGRPDTAHKVYTSRKLLGSLGTA
jgi:hypothetical protein